MVEAEAKPRVTWNMPGLDRIVPVLVQRRKFIALFTLAVFLVSMLAVMMIPPKYETKARVLVKVGREMAAPATIGAREAMPASLRQEAVNSEIEIMKSQHLLGKLVEHFGEDFFYSEPPAKGVVQNVKRSVRWALKQVRALQRETLVRMGLRRRLTPSERMVVILQKGLNVELIRKSDVVEITLWSTSPEAGEMILSKFIDLYKESHIESHKTPKVRDFFDQQVSSILQSLAAAEQEMANFKQSTGAWSTEQQRRLLLDRKHKTEIAQSNRFLRIAGLLAETGRLEAEIAELPEELKTSTEKRINPVVRKLQLQLVDLQVERSELITRYQRDGRTVRDVEQLIEDMQEQIKATQIYTVETMTTGRNVRRRDLKSQLSERQVELQGLNAELKEGDRHLQVIKATLAELEEAEIKHLVLGRQINRLRHDHLLYAERLEDARISDAMQLAKISNVTVISPPVTSLRPVSPRLKLCFLGSILAGLCLSMAIVFIINATRPVVRSRQDVVDILGAPVLARIVEDRKI